MTTPHARDDWESTPGDGEVLARALRTMADGAPAPSADVPSRLRTVRTRVRRRRAAKKTALGAATLGVVAVLAVGATQLPARDSSEPLPAEPPTDGATTADPDDPTATDAPETSPPTVGYQPSWLEGTPVSCGMPADDLAALAGPELTLETRGLGTEEPGVVDTSLTNTGSERFSGVVAGVGPVAWVRDGVVVAVGPNALESPLELELAPDQVLDLGAQAVPTDYCSPDADGTYTTPVAPGDYDLVPYQGVLTGSGADYAARAVGDPVAVTLDSDGTIAPQG